MTFRIYAPKATEVTASGEFLDGLLTANGIERTFRTTAGEHTWIVWRQYLREFAPLLWKTKRS